jgi:nucleoid-associated protein YgaU
MAVPQNATDNQTATAPPAATEPVSSASAQPQPVESIAPQQAQPVTNISNPPAETTAATAEPAASAAPAKAAIVKTNQPAKQTSPNTYVVQSGDTLGAVAKKVYGPEQGNKLSNIEAIFEANRKTLSTMDSLQVGQKLTIPPLASSASSTPANTLTGTNFVKADSVGQRHSSADTAKPAATTTKPAQATKADNTKPGRIYVVKEGDSLWQIASEQLGDGNRYKEIVKLNSDILSSEDDIKVDMKLKLPAK